MRIGRIAVCSVLLFMVFFSFDFVMPMLRRFEPFVSAKVSLVLLGFVALVLGTLLSKATIALEEKIDNSQVWRAYREQLAAQATEQQNFDASLSPAEREIYERGRQKGFAEGRSVGYDDGYGSRWSPPGPQVWP
jgi:hypothetical protein